MADNFNVKDGKWGKQDYLKDGVECDQNSAVVPIAVGQIVPDQYHGDAACNAHKDESFPKVLAVR